MLLILCGLYRLGWLAWRLWNTWRSAGFGQGRASANFDRSVLVVDHQARTAYANRTCGCGLIVAGRDLQFAEIGLHFAAARPRLHLETRLVGQINLNVTAAVVHLHAAQLAHADFNRAILILQTQIATHTGKADILRAGQHAKWPNDVGGAHVPRIHIEIAIEARKLQVCARRFEAQATSDSCQFDVIELAAQPSRPLYIGERNIAAASLNRNIRADVGYAR